MFILALKNKPWNYCVSTLTRFAVLRRLGHKSLCSLKKSDVSVRTSWERWTRSFLQLQALHTQQLILVLFEGTPSGAFNSSRLYSANGKLEANYDKHHLVPGVEPEKTGDKRVTLDQSSGGWGLQICKDMDFPRLSREYASDGANLLLVPAWTSISIVGCTRGWRCYALSKTVSPPPVRRGMDS